MVGLSFEDLICQDQKTLSWSWKQLEIMHGKIMMLLVVLEGEKIALS